MPSIGADSGCTVLPAANNRESGLLLENPDITHNHRRTTSAPLKHRKRRKLMLRMHALAETMNWSHRFPGSYLAAVTDFTEMVSPVAVPVTLACSQANLSSLSSAA